MARLYHNSLAIATALALSACNGAFSLPSLLQNLDEEGRTGLPPLASAGADRELLRGVTARLDGRGSYHPQGHSFTGQWKQIAGDDVHLSNANALTPEFVAPLTEQTLVFQLTVRDNHWLTTDEVRLAISDNPENLPPTVSVGPDRFLDFGESAMPSTNGVAEDVVWEAISAELIDPNLPPAAFEPVMAVTILRGRREEDGLRSAVDYQLLHPFSLETRGSQAPTASLLRTMLNTSDTTLIAPGDSIKLDASDSTDANGNSLRFRWQQVRGDIVAAVASAGDSATLDLTVPARPQHLTMRVSVSDGFLESAAAEISLAVSSEARPFVSVRADRRSHPGNVVYLDANPALTAADASIVNTTYLWQQTYGKPATLSDADDGGHSKVVSFVAPAAPDDLAFAVTAEADGVRSPTAVRRVTVVDTDDNTSPTITFCIDGDTETPREKVRLTAFIQDPEGDSLSAPQWRKTADQNINVTLEPVDPPIFDALCGAPAGATDDLSRTSVQMLAHLEQTAVGPEPRTATIAIDVCDNLGDCESEEIVLTAPAL